VGAVGGVHYNYEVMQWYIENWNGSNAAGYSYVNPHATSITFGIYFPLAALFFWKLYYKPSAEFKKTRLYAVYNFSVVTSTLLAMVISGKVAFDIISTDDTYHAQNLSIVGSVPEGLHIFRMPVFEQRYSKFFIDVLPLTIISYMESFRYEMYDA
jgi:MFS superfamily sulfate permease-like transporter